MNKHIPLDQLTVAELVQRFLSLTLGQYDAERRSEISKYNRLYGRMNEISPCAA
jgi:hypothetical protein